MEIDSHLVQEQNVQEVMIQMLWYWVVVYGVEMCS